MKYYSKITAKNTKEKAIDILSMRGASVGEIVFDDTSTQKQEGSLYSELKNTLIKFNEPLTIDTLTSIGKNSREIFKELDYFRNNGIKLYVADLDFTYNKSVDPMLALDKIFEKLAEIEKSNVKAAQKPAIDEYIRKNGSSNYGRQKLPYPANWNQDYTKWKNGEITAAEFMSRSGLKKGTFYNMIKEYKSINPEEISRRA